MVPAPRNLILRDADGHEIAATLWESGRACGAVVVHGLLGTRDLREIVRVAEALSRWSDVVAIDVRGHGTTPGRFTWGREEWKGVAAAATHLAREGRPVSAVGFSFGGFHALRAAARGVPLDRLVVVGAPVDQHVLDHFPLGPKLWRHLPAVVRRRRRRMRFEPPPIRRREALGAEELARVGAPVLVVHGGSDWLVSRRHAEGLVAGLPAATFEEISGGLHGEYLVHSHGDLLIAAIDRFLRAGRTGEPT